MALKIDHGTDHHGMDHYEMDHQHRMDHDMNTNGTSMSHMMKMYFHIGHESIPLFFENWILDSDSSIY